MTIEVEDNYVVEVEEDSNISEHASCSSALVHDCREGLRCRGDTEGHAQVSVVAVVVLEAEEEAEVLIDTDVVIGVFDIQLGPEHTRTNRSSQCTVIFHFEGREEEEGVQSRAICYLSKRSVRFWDEEDGRKPAYLPFCRLLNDLVFQFLLDCLAQETMKMWKKRLLRWQSRRPVRYL
jgi:hypothetical protein